MAKSRWAQRYDHTVALLQAVVLKELGKEKFQATVGGVWNKIFSGVTPKSIRVNITSPGFCVISCKGIRDFRRMTDAINYFASL